RPRRQMATISSVSLSSTRSTRTGVPRIAVVNGQARCSSSIVRKPTRCSDSPYASMVASSISAVTRRGESRGCEARLFPSVRGMMAVGALRGDVAPEGSGPAVGREFSDAPLWVGGDSQQDILEILEGRDALQ